MIRGVAPGFTRPLSPTLATPARQGEMGGLQRGPEAAKPARWPIMVHCVPEVVTARSDTPASTVRGRVRPNSRREPAGLTSANEGRRGTPPASSLYLLRSDYTQRSRAAKTMSHHQRRTAPWSQRPIRSSGVEKETQADLCRRHPLLLLLGTTGLIYEVLWTRILGLVFGHTVFAITTVLAAFMAGLGLGSYLSGGIADRTPAPSDSTDCSKSGSGFTHSSRRSFFRGLKTSTSRSIGRSGCPSWLSACRSSCSFF